MLCLSLYVNDVAATENYKDHGIIFKASYSPFGMGILRSPYLGENAGSVSTKTNEGEDFFSSLRYNTSLAYYYEFLQCEFRYNKTIVDNQFITPDRGDIVPVKGTRQIYEIKLGSRFSKKGDPAYSLIYFSLKSMQYSSSYRDTELTGLGYTVGYNGLYTYGLNHPVEFAISAGLFNGIYQYNRYSSQIGTDASKRYSFTAGGSLGAGLYYEPLDLGLLITAHAMADRIAFNATYNNREITLDAGSMDITIGLELIFQFPFTQYRGRTP